MNPDPGLGTVGSWVLGTVAVLLAAVVLPAALAAVTFATRGTPFRRVRALDDRVGGGAGRNRADERIDGMSPLPARSEEFCDVARVLAKTALTDGHRVHPFFTGDALFEALLGDVAGAQRFVAWHVFWSKPGRLADRVADALIERAGAGVRVLMLLDHYGSKGTPASYKRKLRDGGVELAVFRPPRWNTLYKAQHRMHIRAVVLDGRVGYTGGFGIDDRWLGDGKHPGQWRDTSVRVEGPAVEALQGAFVSNWAEATGDLLLGNHVFPFDTPEEGSCTAGLLYSSPSLGSTSAERFFVTSIAAARERCWLSTGYFVPDRYLRRLLCEAAARGVDVRILTPGGNTDRPSTWYAARAHYPALLEAGVRIHEYRPTMMHAKTLVVDGIWGMIGTLNFDNRSLVLNDEVGLLFHDRGLGGTLESAFRADLEHADEMSVEGEQSRTGARDRLRSFLAERVSRLL